MRVFFSYAREDKEPVIELAKLPPFIKPWVDLRNLSGAEGNELDPSIQTAIDNSHVFVAVLSHASASSPWVQKEISWALRREKERHKSGLDRRFVLPVRIDPDLDLSACPAPFSTLASKIYIDSRDRNTRSIKKARGAIEHALFRWTCEWLDHFEPEGDSSRQFIDELGRDLGEFQTRLFAVKAVLAWPLPTLVKDDAVAHLIEVKDRYNDFANPFVAALESREEEVRSRLGPTAQKAFTQLSTFIRNDIYHGAAFALNDVIESVNAYDAVLSKNPEALAAAETRRLSRVAALEPIMAELVRRTTSYIDLLKP